MPLLDALDPDRFARAWALVEEAIGPTAPSLMPPGTRNPDLAVLADNPQMRWVLAVQQVFQEPVLASSCTFRILFAATLRDAGDLGPFFHKEYGVWSDAIPVLAVARCDSRTGYDLTDLQARLALIPPPPTE